MENERKDARNSQTYLIFTLKEGKQIQTWKNEKGKKIILMAK